MEHSGTLYGGHLSNETFLSLGFSAGGRETTTFLGGGGSLLAGTTITNFRREN